MGFKPLQTLDKPGLDPTVLVQILFQYTIMPQIITGMPPLELLAESCSLQ